MNLIAQNLSAKRGQHLLFHKLNFIVQKGECLLIKGANGAGKSTLLRILAGLFTSFKGALFLQNEQKQKIYNPYHYCHYLNYKDAMKPTLTLADNLKFWQNYYKAPKQKTEQIIHEMQLDPLQYLPFHMLSTGQKKRSAFSRILLIRRPIWLLDEPLTGLDQESTKLLTDTMEKHLQKKGIIITASHQELTLKNKKDLYIEKFH